MLGPACLWHPASCQQQVQLEEGNAVQAAGSVAHGSLAIWVGCKKSSSNCRTGPAMQGVLLGCRCTSALHSVHGSRCSLFMIACRTRCCCMHTDCLPGAQSCSMCTAALLRLQHKLLFKARELRGFISPYPRGKSAVDR